MWIKCWCIEDMIVTLFRVFSGQGKVREIPDQANIREKSGNFSYGSGKNQILRKIREFFIRYMLSSKNVVKIINKLHCKGIQFWSWSLARVRTMSIGNGCIRYLNWLKFDSSILLKFKALTSICFIFCLIVFRNSLFRWSISHFVRMIIFEAVSGQQ